MDGNRGGADPEEGYAEWIGTRGTARTMCVANAEERRGTATWRNEQWGMRTGYVHWS